MWDLVGNSKDRFSHVTAHLWSVLSLSDTSMVSKSSTMFPAKPSNKSVIVLKDCPLLTAFDFPVSV